MLSFQPVVFAVVSVNTTKKEQCKKSCCHNNVDAKKKKSSKPWCADNLCNPFAQCSCCNGFIMASAYQMLNLVSSEINFKQFAPAFILSEENEFWQPPKQSIVFSA
jgi:hypothetical protein